MVTEPFLSLREPIAPNWREEIADLSDSLSRDGQISSSQAARLRRLAAMRFGDGERLWLRRLVKRTRSLAEPLPGFRRFRVLIVSNRMTTFLASDLEAAGVARGLLIEAVETDYDAVRSLALANSALSAGTVAGEVDAVFLLLDAGFFPDEGRLLDDAFEAQRASEVAVQLETIVRGLRARFRAPVIAATVAVAPERQWSSADLSISGTGARQVFVINHAITACAKAGLAVLFDLAGLAAKFGTMAFFDPVRFHQAKVPFSMDASPVVADRGGRLYRYYVASKPPAAAKDACAHQLRRIPVDAIDPVVDALMARVVRRAGSTPRRVEVHEDELHV